MSSKWPSKWFGFLRFLLIGSGLVLPVSAPALAAPPTNDDFDSAIVIGLLPFASASLDTTEATAAGDDPDCVGNSGSVWYAFTPSKNLTIEANTLGSDYNTTLGVFTGTRGALTMLACDDDYFSSAGPSRIIFNAQAGTTYYFMAGLCCSTGGSGGGSLVLNVQKSSFHDVGIVKIERPKSARAGQTRPIKVYVRNYGQAETVLVQLYRGTLLSGFEFAGELEKAVPFQRGNSTSFSFNYTFTEVDAALGQVVFSALAFPIGVPDDRPADNLFVSLPVTVRPQPSRHVTAAEIADELSEETDTVSNPDIPNPALLPKPATSRIFLPVVARDAASTSE